LGCSNFGQNIFLNKTNLTPMFYRSMLGSCNNSKTKRIFIGAGVSPGNLIAYTNEFSIVGNTIT